LHPSLQHALQPSIFLELKSLSYFKTKTGESSLSELFTGLIGFPTSTANFT